MNPAGPVALAPAIVAAVVAMAILVGVVVRLVSEFRTRRTLLSELAELDAFDGDVLRFVRRTYLLLERWRPKLTVAGREEGDAKWDEILDLARDLQRRRAASEDGSDLVARLVVLEDELDALIDRARR